LSGGSVEFGERCEDAVKREIMEEFDFHIAIIDLLDVVNHIIPEEKQHWVSPTYLAKIVSGTPKIMEPEKCSEIKWIIPQDINQAELTIASKYDLEVYKKKQC
jgi:ADP-ribose pyrophosphatase YjhB (NUDIX family)